MQTLIKKLLIEALTSNFIYHGSDKKITDINPSKIKGGVRAIHGWGVYFTDSLNKAHDYGEEITYLDISNMNILDTRDEVNEKFISKIEELSKKNDSNISIFYGIIASKLKKQIGKDIDTARKNIADTFNWDINEHWSKMLVKLGYDIMKNGYEYVVINFDKANNSLVK